MATEINRPQNVDIIIVPDRGMFSGNPEHGKITCGIVTSKSINASDNVIYLGMRGYHMMNLKTKRLTLYYNNREKRLMKLSELSSEQGIDMMSALSHNLTTAVGAARNSLGLNVDMNTMGKWIAVIIALVAIVALVFLYLMTTHGSGAATAPQVAGNSTLIHIPTGS